MPLPPTSSSSDIEPEPLENGPPSACPRPINNPSKTGYDPSGPSWLNLFNQVTGRMTYLGQVLRMDDYHIQNEESDCQRCEEQTKWLFQYSPIVRFTRSKLNDLNGDIDENKVFCRRCPIIWTKDGQPHMRQKAGVHFDHGIQVCANFVRRRSELEDTLAHEMTHAWDHLRWNVDWNNLRHAACSEIRAASLSGECRWTIEFFTRSQMSVSQQHQRCVRMRAIKSIMGRPNCKDDVEATRAVNEVWDSCYSDTRPFDEIYR